MESENLPITEGVITSHKEEYAQALYALIISFPEEKPGSTLKQKDVDCDTLQWFNATYSMFTYHSGADYHLIGGYSDESGVVDSYVSSGLAQSWGITDRATAIESIAWLASNGHVPQYVEEIQFMDSLGLLTCDEYELRTFFAQVADAQGWTQEESANTMNYYINLKNTYDACGENGIDAWDYCRIMQLCGSCYYAGFLTLEESLSIQLATAKAIQSQFDSWDTMNASNRYPFQLSTSIGGAGYKAVEIEDLSVLIELADQSMYTEKRRKKELKNKNDSQDNRE